MYIYIINSICVYFVYICIYTINHRNSATQKIATWTLPPSTGLRLAPADPGCARRRLGRLDAEPDGARAPTAAGWAAGPLGDTRRARFSRKNGELKKHVGRSELRSENWALNQEKWAKKCDVCGWAEWCLSHHKMGVSCRKRDARF